MLHWMCVLLFASCAGTRNSLNLQVLPSPVFEGDPLILMCQGQKSTAPYQVTFYKDRRVLHIAKVNQSLFIGAATVKSSGQYWCIRELITQTFEVPITSPATMVQVQELFQVPVLSADPSAAPREGSPWSLRCQTELHPQKSALQLLFSFSKNNRTVQNISRHAELCIPEVRKEDSGVYRCKVALEGGQVQKQSPPLEIRVQTPVSRPLLSLRRGAAGPAMGDVIELRCEAQKGSPPVLYSFYRDGEVLGNHSVLHSGAASLLLPVRSEQGAGDYTCEASNSVSSEESEPVELALDGSQGSSAPAGSNWLLAGLPGSLLGVTVVAAALLVYFRPWTKVGPPIAQNPPPASRSEQCPLDSNGYRQEEENEGLTYSVVQTIPKRNKASPAECALDEKAISVVYAEVRCPWLSEVPSKDSNRRSRTSQDPLGNPKDVSYYQ